MTYDALLSCRYIKSQNVTLSEIKKTHQILKWENFKLNKLILNLRAAAGVIKVGTGPCFHCVASPLLLTTVYKRLGSEESSCWMFGKGMLSHCCLIEDPNCSTDLLCCVFGFLVSSCLSKVVCPDWTVWWDGSGPEAICLTARPSRACSIWFL